MVYLLKVQDEKPRPTPQADVIARHLPTPLPDRERGKALLLADNRIYCGHISDFRNPYLSAKWHTHYIVSDKTVMA